MALPKKDKKSRTGRTYEDFKFFTAENSNIPIVEMDTVHCTRNQGKVLLTLIFRSCSLMIAFLIDSCTKESVKEAIDKLYEQLGPEIFRDNFPILLTDNGSEFEEPEALEYDINGVRRTKIFPKGKSLNKYNQEDVTLVLNHINSVARASLDRATLSPTPFKLAQLLINNSLLDKLNLKEIPADEVHLKPALIKKIR